MNIGLFQHLPENMSDNLLFNIEAAWIIIVGGYDLNSELTSVELHNWKTGQQCLSTSLPYGNSYISGVVMEQMPAFCGGMSSDSVSTCYKFDIAKKQWTQV